ncbi:MAG: helix-turn-helix transcriptional regulator [Solirubrobacteraceae bacterium]
MNRGFGKSLQAARKQRDFSQDQLAIAAGLHRTHISLLERGRREPSLDTLVKLCRALGVSPSEAITWHVPGPRAERHSVGVRDSPPRRP